MTGRTSNGALIFAAAILLLPSPMLASGQADERAVRKPPQSLAQIEVAAAGARQAGRWREAMEAYARAAALRDQSGDPAVQRLAGRMWLGAANAAAMDDRWDEATSYATTAIARLDPTSDVTAQGPLIGFARTILAEAALNRADYDTAWAIATAAVREVVAWERIHGTDFDLRQRYQDRAHRLPDAREIRALAGAMRFSNAPRREQFNIFRAFVDAGARARNSSLADAMLLARQRVSAAPAARQAVDRLVEANARLDAARRAMLTGDRNAQNALAAAQRLIEEAAGTAAGHAIVLRAPRVSLDTLTDALQPGEGFLFLHASPYGILTWGVDAKRVPFVDSQKLALPRPGTVTDHQAFGILRGLDRQLHYEIGRKAGYAITDMSTALVQRERFTVGSPYIGDTTRRPGHLVLNDILRGEAIRIADSLLELRSRARWWTIGYSDALDGMPLAMLRYTENDYFGTIFPYAVTPSIDAFIAQRADRSSGVDFDFVGVGDIPFRASPCSEWQSAPTPFPATYREQRDWILGQKCLEGALDQMGGLSKSSRTRPILLAGENATESALETLRGRRVGTLAFVTHALPAKTVSGGWPALLLYPPEARTQGDDGRLLPADATALGIRADLVLLSACSTGAADTALGEEPLAGLARGFFLGGARSAIVTRWQIKFIVAGAMNRALATALSQGKSRAEAMLEARRAGQKVPGSRVWDWGAFELVGDGGPLS